MDGLGIGDSIATASPHGRGVVLIARSIGIIIFIAAVISVLFACMFMRHILFVSIYSFGVLTLVGLCVIGIAIAMRIGNTPYSTFSKFSRKLCY